MGAETTTRALTKRESRLLALLAAGEGQHVQTAHLPRGRYEVAGEAFSGATFRALDSLGLIESDHYTSWATPAGLRAAEDGA